MSILLVTVSVVGVYADVFFWARAAQNIVLLTITPTFLALAAPLTLLRDVLPAPARQRASQILHSATAQMLTFPPGDHPRVDRTAVCAVSDPVVGDQLAVAGRGRRSERGPGDHRLRIFLDPVSSRPHPARRSLPAQHRHQHRWSARSCPPEQLPGMAWWCQGSRLGMFQGQRWHRES